MRIWVFSRKVFRHRTIPGKDHFHASLPRSFGGDIRSLFDPKSADKQDGVILFGWNTRRRIGLNRVGDCTDTFGRQSSAFEERALAMMDYGYLPAKTLKRKYIGSNCMTGDPPSFVRRRLPVALSGETGQRISNTRANFIFLKIILTPIAAGEEVVMCGQHETIFHGTKRFKYGGRQKMRPIMEVINRVGCIVLGDEIHNCI